MPWILTGVSPVRYSFVNKRQVKFFFLLQRTQMGVELEHLWLVQHIIKFLVLSWQQISAQVWFCQTKKLTYHLLANQTVGNAGESIACAFRKGALSRKLPFNHTCGVSYLSRVWTSSYMPIKYVPKEKAPNPKVQTMKPTMHVFFF